MAKNLSGVPAVRLSSRLQLAAIFPPPGARGAGRRRSAPTPALMVDVRVVIRRHFPVGPPCSCRIIVQEVAEDIALRRQHARKLRLPERVERALAADVLPLVDHPFDRGAVVASTGKICEYVASVCADPRLAKGGARVLVLLDTFACPAFLRPLPRKTMRIPAKHAVVTMRTNECTKMESGIAAAAVEKARPIGVIGDGQTKQVEAEERWKGWLPW